MMLATLEAAPDLPSFAGSLLRMIGVLAILLGALVVALLLAKRIGRGRWNRPESAAIEIEGVCPLEPGRRLYVVRVEGRRILIGSSPSGLRTLATLDHPASFEDAMRAAPATEVDPSRPSEEES